MEITIQTDSITSESKEKLSPLQKEYRKFIKARLSALDKKSPFEGTDDEIADFFEEVAEDWDKYKKNLDITD